MESYFEGDQRLGAKQVPIYLTVLFVVYLFLSFFEAYLTTFIGTNTRYLIFLIAVLFLFHHQWRVRKTAYMLFFVLWFLLKTISIAWSSGVSTDVSRLFASQIGAILLLLALCGHVHDRRFLRMIILSNYWFSFLFGLLSIGFHQSFKSDVFVARQVLTLFGQQNDPNNCAAYLAIGLAIAAYSLASEKRMKVLNIIVVAVNAYGIMLTASRTGFLLMACIVVVLVLMPNKNDRFVLGAFVRRLVMVTVVFVISAYLIDRYLPEASLNRMLAFDEYSGGSGRDEKWTKAIALIRQRPLFGWGWGGYKVGAGVVHNTLLTMLCDVGFVGTSLFVIPLVILSSGLIKNKYQLALLLLVAGIFPALAIDSINKRYFWNAIIIPIMMLESYQVGEEMVAVWPEKGSARSLIGGGS